jgi:predicted dehydrogenase
MDLVRIGVIGGGMGRLHLNYMSKLTGAAATAFCDIHPGILKQTAAEFKVRGFADYREMIDSKTVDAVLIATPHTTHPTIAAYAFGKGVHVLCEKPVAVTVRQAQAMNRAHTRSRVVFAVMFQERTRPLYRKIKDLVGSGELGALLRINWIITTWFRTQEYYRSGSWRATWSGEGGGVLLNQCPHQLDLLQWITGLPRTVDAHICLGKHHRIAVEDEVTAYLEYANGATGVFITSTGEYPGTNRLELMGDRGKLVMENDSLRFSRTRQPVAAVRKNGGKWDVPEAREVTIPVPQRQAGHQVLTQNFVDAILRREPLIAPGPEGLRSLSLGNAMLMSGLTGKPVKLPLDAAAYERLLQGLIKKEKKNKK